MKARLWAALCLSFLIFSVSVARAQIFSPLPPEVWPSIIDTPLTPGDIIVELRYRNYQAAWRIAKDLAIIEARAQVHKAFQSKVRMTQLARDLNKILDDPAKTDVDKADELLTLTDASLEPAVMQSSSALNVTLQHSIELGVTRLEWDDKVRTGSCSGGMVSFNCSSSGGGNWSCGAGGSYSTVYYRSQPDYAIYRILNGQEKLISVLKGSMQNSGNQGFTLSDSLWKSAWSTAKYYYNSRGLPYRDVVPGRAFFYDFNADMRNPGDTLQYKIITYDDWLMPPQVCGAGTGGIHTATVTADGDGNGRMDYLANADYTKYFKKYYGWLPVINSMLDE